MKRLVICTLILSLTAGCVMLSGCSNDFATTIAVSEENNKEKSYIKAEGIVESTERKVITSIKADEVAISPKVGEEVCKGDILASYKDGETLVCPYEKAVVTEVSVIDGEVAEPGKKLLTLSNIGTKVINAEVSERDIKDVEKGVKVDIIPTADCQKFYKGEVKDISNCAVKKDNGNNVVNIAVSIDGEDINSEYLKEGYTVSLKIKKK